jgi:endo-1,4-beta-xylanase
MVNRILRACIGLVLLASGSANAQIDNPGFESGTAPWIGIGASMSVSSSVVRTGNLAGRLTGRTAFWNSIAQSVIGELTPGHVYRFSAWVYADAPGDHLLKLTAQQIDANGTNYPQIDARTRPGQQWHQLTGVFQYEPVGTVTTFLLYAEGPEAGVDLYLDDVTLESLGSVSGWKDEANARIETVRKRDAKIRVVDQSGSSIEGAVVRVEQDSSDFAFGSAIADSAVHIPQYRAFFTEHFEWAVPENAGKWPSNEPSPGVLRYAQLDSIVQFCETNDISLRGHTIFWSVDQYVQDWVKSLGNPDLFNAMDQRITSLLTRHHNAFKHWDVNNEMLHGSFYQDRLGPGIRPWMFTSAKQVNPLPTLFVNDYNVVASNETNAYIDQIQGLLNAGAPVGGIGAQGHFFGDVQPWLVYERLERLSTVGLPIWITELDVSSPDPLVRADRLEDAMRICFSHPAVEGIVLWGFWEGRHWRGADAALVNLDWTINAAGQRLLDLLDEWTTEADLTTNTDGRTEFRGFLGTYRSVVTLPDGSSGEREFDLPAGAGLHEITLVGPFGPAAPSCTGDIADEFGNLTPDGQVSFGDFLALLGRVGVCP